MLASIWETLLSTVDTLLDDMVEESKRKSHSLSDLNDKTDVQQLFESFKIKPSIPMQRNELQFHFFIGIFHMAFLFSWHF